MPTLNKLEYLDETKHQIKNALNTKFNSGITDNDTFRSYVTKINNIYTNWPKVTGEGTNITLSNTKKGKMEITPKGNTEQTTYTGKNLFDKSIVKSQGDGRIGDTTLDTGKRLTWNGASSTTGYMWLGYVIKDISNYVDKVVRFKTNFNASDSNTPQYAIGICDSDGDNRTSKASSSTSGNTISFTIPSLSGTQTYLYVLLYINSGGNLAPNDYVDFTDMILTIDNEDMTYEPYVGGPSPNPDYPQDIKVVKGNNTITISDGTNSENYSINLGSIELCKIGTYQDYIYKSDDKWYKKTYIGKVVLDGSENWLLRSDVSQASGFYTFRNDDYVAGEFNTNSNGYSSHFVVLTSSSTTTNHIRFVNSTGYGTQICIDGSIAQTSQALKTWLSTNNVEVYYIKTTPTDTQITDTDLIGQLEQVFMSYDNPTNITSTYATGNSQMILSASALMKGGN